MIPSCRIAVLFPAMLGPVIRRIWSPLPTRRSLGTKRPSRSWRSTTGCRPPEISTTCPSSTTGREYPPSSAVSARAASTSMAPVAWAHSCTWGAQVETRSRSSANNRLSPLGDALGGVEYPGFPFLQTGDDVALGIGKGLLALVIVGNPFEVRLADFDVIAEHLVETDLQRGDPGAFTLAALKPGDPVSPPGLDLPELVELLVVAVAEDAAFRHRCGWVVDEGGADQFDEPGRVREVGESLFQRRGPVAGPGQIPHQQGDLRDPGERIRQSGEVAGARPAATDARGKAFEISYFSELKADAGADRGGLEKRRHGVQPAFDGRRIKQRRCEPLVQKAGPHGRAGAVEYLDERAGAAVLLVGGEQLEVPLRRRVEKQVVAAAPAADAVYVGDGSALVFTQVLEHSACGPHPPDRRRRSRSCAASAPRAARSGTRMRAGARTASLRGG